MVGVEEIKRQYASQQTIQFSISIPVKTYNIIRAVMEEENLNRSQAIAYLIRQGFVRLLEKEGARYERYHQKL